MTVVVCDVLDVAEVHRQLRLGARQRLALALLVHADYQCVVRRAQVQPHHVAQLLDEEQGAEQFETFDVMRLQAEELEMTPTAGLGDSCLDRQRAHAPARRTVGRLGVRRGVDQLRHTFVVDPAMLAWAQIVVQAGDASLDEARGALAYRGLGQFQTRGDGIVGVVVGTAQVDACPRAQSRRQRANADKGLKLQTLRFRQHQLRRRSACSHRGIPVLKIYDRYTPLTPNIVDAANWEILVGWVDY